jgi:hypothetical protein
MMKLFLFVFLALASAGPLERLIQKVDTSSLGLLQRCTGGNPILLDMENLPGNGRVAGDPCADNEQCLTGLKCLCQTHGGKECANQCVVQDVVIPTDGEFHNVHCTMRCKCTETGELQCVDMCPAVAIDCPQGQTPATVPPAEGQCCGTPACRIDQTTWTAVASGAWESDPNNLAQGKGGWNSGSWPEQWITFSPATPTFVRFVRLEIDQLPTPALTTHVFSISTTSAPTLTPVQTLTGTTAAHQWLQVDVNQQISAFQAKTTVSPSWVAWFNVEFYA